LHGSHPRPYTEIKRILIQAFDITNQERYVNLTKMKLESDKPSALLLMMKLSFRGKRLHGALLELLRGLFLQALPKSIKLHLLGEKDISIEDLATKADAIHAELSTSDSVPVPPPTRYDQPSSSRFPVNNYSSPNDRTAGVSRPTFTSNRSSNILSSTSNDPGCFDPSDVPNLCWYHLTYGPVNACKCHGKPYPMFPCLGASKNA